VGYECLNKNVSSSRWNHDSVLHTTTSGGRLFHNRAPATANDRFPTVKHCDWRTSSLSVSDDRRRRLDGMSDKRHRSAARQWGAVSIL